MCGFLTAKPLNCQHKKSFASDLFDRRQLSLMSRLEAVVQPLTARNSTAWFLPPGRYCFGCVCFYFFFMFARALSLEWLDGSQLKFHTRWRGKLARTLLENGRCQFNRLAAILEKHCFPAPGGLILASSSSCFFVR